MKRMVRAQEMGIVRCCFILSFSARSYIRLGGIVRGCLVSRGSMPHFVQPDPMPNEDFEIWYIHPSCLSFLHTASLKNKKDSLRRSLLSLPPPPSHLSSTFVASGSGCYGPNPAFGIGPPAEIMTEDGDRLASAAFGTSGSAIRGSDVTSAVRVWLITMRSRDPYRSRSLSSCSCGSLPPLAVLTMERVQPEP